MNLNKFEKDFLEIKDYKLYDNQEDNSIDAEFKEYTKRKKFIAHKALTKEEYYEIFEENFTK